MVISRIIFSGVSIKNHRYVMGSHIRRNMLLWVLIASDEALLMSTHNMFF